MYALKSEKPTILNELFNYLFDVEKLEYCFDCGKCTASCPMVELFQEIYNPRIILERILLDPVRVFSDEGIWLCAWCYRCYRKCPQNLKIPEILLELKKIAFKKGYIGRFERSLKLIAKKIAFPATFLMVCLHPKRVGIDEKTISNLLETIKIESEKDEKIPKIKKDKVAIIGSGPAGLTAAYELRKKGYSVTVFDNSN